MSKTGSKEHFLEELGNFGEKLYDSSFKSYNQEVENHCVSEYVFDFGYLTFEFHYGETSFEKKRGEYGNNSV